MGFLFSVKMQFSVEMHIDGVGLLLEVLLHVIDCMINSGWSL